MWNYSAFKFKFEIDKNLIEKFKKYATIGGIIFILLGLAGIFFPVIMTFSTLIFVSYLLLVAGLSSAWLTWINHRTDWLGWLKSIILIGVALYMIFYPLGGVAALGLLFSFYFFMDSFGSIALAGSSEDTTTKWLWIANAITSFLLAFIFIIKWPFSSLWLVGLFVGISLFFDGIALLSGVYAIKKEEENTKE